MWKNPQFHRSLAEIPDELLKLANFLLVAIAVTNIQEGKLREVCPISLHVARSIKLPL
jgi:hypothetical protein